ncbi:MAG: bifunctional metallophosphatase/5'-nucleotidase [Luteibaculaceae bacterium]
MNRRKFVINTFWASTGVAVVGPALLASCGNGSAGKKIPKKIVILHTNDQHSRIEPFPDTDPRNAGRGGFARRATLIQQIRKENEHVLLFDCGDIIQGTPYFNMFKGSLEIELMNKMGYDAATVGNHEFDGGIENLASLIDQAEFPFLSANYNFSGNVVAGKTQAYKIFELEDFKIGVFGLGIKLAGLVDPEMSAGTVYNDPIKTANETAALLKEKGCDYVIVLSHLGHEYDNKNYPSDVVLASQSKDINMILGGHTHTFLNEPQKIANQSGMEVIINQVGWAGINLGMLTLENQGEHGGIVEKSRVLQIGN